MAQGEDDGGYGDTRWQVILKKKKMTEELQKKVDRAIRLLRSTCKDDVVELSYSGGKDSDVILELAKMAGIKYRAIYKNTTIDPPGTIKHVRENGVEVMPPRKSFFQIIQQKGFPTRRARFCCEVLKEYKVMDKAIQGIRRSESTARAKRYTEPTMCRFYGSKKNHVNVILPILDFTDSDVEEFIKERGIRLHPLYYNEDGSLNVKRRLGCMGCPMVTDRGLHDFKAHPNLVRAWLRAGKKWWDTHPNTSAQKMYTNIYDLFVSNVFYDSYESAMLGIGGGFLTTR